MTTAQAINTAMKVFNKENKTVDIRTVALQEGSGANGRWNHLRIRIGYAIEGDYTESDKSPFEVNVYKNDQGKIVGEKIGN